MDFIFNLFIDFLVKNGIRVFDEKLDLDTLVSSLKQSSVTNNLLDLGNSNVDSTSKGITAITVSFWIFI